jgi:Ca2+-transporting ATPase
MMRVAQNLEEPSLLDAEAVAGKLGTDLESGLRADEAAVRLARDGPNELRAAPREPTWRRLLRQFQDPVIYLLLAAMAIALAAWLIENEHIWPADAIVRVAAATLNGCRKELDRFRL